MIIMIVVLLVIVMAMIGWCISYLWEIRAELRSMWQEEEVIPEDPDDPEWPNIFRYLDE